MNVRCPLHAVLAAITLMAAVAAMAGTNAEEVQAVEQPGTETANRMMHPQAPWLGSLRHGNVIYLLYRDEPRIERYDLAAREWLPDVALPRTPAALAVDEAHYYIAYERSLFRTGHGGEDETHLANTPQDIRYLFLDDSFLFYIYSDMIASREKATGEFISEVRGRYYTPRGGVIAPSLRAIAGRSSGVSPSDVTKVRYNNRGELSAAVNSPYHGSYPGASWVALMPDGERVVDSAGIIYNIDGLTYDGSMGGAMDSIAFDGERPVLRRGNRLDMISERFGILASHEPDHTILLHEVFDGQAVTFSAGAEKPTVTWVPLEEFAAPEPAQVVDPTRLAYEPDAILKGEGGIIYLLHRSSRNVFRWSLADREYLEPIPLSGTPDFNCIAYSPENGHLYLAYPDQRITRFSADLSGEEEFMVNLAYPPLGLVAVGEFILAVDRSGAWYSHHVFDHDGNHISSREWNRRSRVYVWSPANRRLYHFRDGISPNDVHWQEIGHDGVIGDHGDSPQHGGVDVSLPLSVSPDGTKILTGGGVIRDGMTLAAVDYLANSVNAAAWHGEQLFTGRTLGRQTEIQKWSEDTYAIEATQTLPGETLELFRTGEDFLAITLDGGFPRFHILDTSLDVKFQSSIPTTMLILR